jgi:hypothetical protein
MYLPIPTPGGKKSVNYLAADEAAISELNVIEFYGIYERQI